MAHNSCVAFSLLFSISSHSKAEQQEEKMVGVKQIHLMATHINIFYFVCNNHIATITDFISR